MSQISPNRITDNACFGFVQTHARWLTMHLHSQEGTQRKGEVVLLPGGLAYLSAFNAAAVLEPSMRGLDAPALVVQLLAGRGGHVQIIRRPVFRVTVWGHCRKHPDEAIPFPMHNWPFRRNLDLLNGHMASSVWSDQAIALEPGQPVPAMTADSLEILRLAY